MMCITQVSGKNHFRMINGQVGNGKSLLEKGDL